MKAILARNTKSDGTDWSSAAEEYFNWRAKTLGVEPSYIRATPEDEAAAAAESALREQTRASERQQRFRESAEQALRARLIDPDSAVFDWPYGFAFGYWKPFLQKRVEGYYTCGVVNARNRMGGYAGRTHFVVVLGEDAGVRYVELGSGRQFDALSLACQKTASSLPQALPVSSRSDKRSELSLADELQKLADLKDQGVISEAEFQQLKSKLITQ